MRTFPCPTGPVSPSRQSCDSDKTARLHSNKTRRVQQPQPRSAPQRISDPNTSPNKPKATLSFPSPISLVNQNHRPIYRKNDSRHDTTSGGTFATFSTANCTGPRQVVVVVFTSTLID